MQGTEWIKKDTVNMILEPNNTQSQKGNNNGIAEWEQTVVLVLLKMKMQEWEMQYKFATKI